MAFAENVNILKFLKEVEPVSCMGTPPCRETPLLKVFQNGFFSEIMETLLGGRLILSWVKKGSAIYFQKFFMVLNL